VGQSIRAEAANQQQLPKTNRKRTLPFAVKLLGALVFVPVTTVLAQSPKDSPAPVASPGPSKTELTEVAKTGENHKLLAGMTGTRAFVGKHTFPGPAKRTFEFKGTVVKKALLNGRYFMTETTGAPQKWRGQTANWCPTAKK